jgi:hypothetical protein
MNWALHQSEVRFEIRAERAEYERLFRHQARVLQDRLVRLGGGDRTNEIPIAEWEKLYQKEAQHEDCSLAASDWKCLGRTSSCTLGGKRDTVR